MARNVIPASLGVVDGVHAVLSVPPVIGLPVVPVGKPDRGPVSPLERALHAAVVHAYVGSDIRKLFYSHECITAQHTTCKQHPGQN